MYYLGSASNAVVALEKELQYSREVIEEQRVVIEQLHRGYPLPGQPTLIHPFDMSELLNKASVKDIFHVTDQYPSNIITIGGIRYKQSPFMPQIGHSIR